MWIDFNNNPVSRRVGDCAIRSVAKALGTDWETAYTKIAANGFQMANVPTANEVWGSVLRQNGFVREIIPNTCPDCYTVAEFAKDNKTGVYVVATDDHAVAVVDGNYYDTFDCGKEVAIYYWRKQ